MTYCHYKHLFRIISFIYLTSFTISSRAWIPDVILFESKNISLTFELRGSLGIPRPVPSTLKFFPLGVGLGIPSERRSSKVRLIVLLSNRMTSGIHAHIVVIAIVCGQPKPHYKMQLRFYEVTQYWNIFGPIFHTMRGFTVVPNNIPLSCNLAPPSFLLQCPLWNEQQQHYCNLQLESRESFPKMRCF